MLQGWKTLIFGAAVAVVGVLQGANWAALLPSDPKLVGWVVSGIGFVAMALRFFTTTPVGTTK